MADPRNVSEPEPFPVGLKQQFVRHLPRYLAGVVLLGAYQGAQLWFDFRLRDAINAAVGGDKSEALMLGIGLVLVALGAWVIRILSRVVVFNAGRIAEYELRTGLLLRLQQLGPSFYQRMPAGE